VIPTVPSGAAPLASLPAALALEVDSLCDDFERLWRRARRRGTSPPDPEAFTLRAVPAARAALRACLHVLGHELRNGPALPDIPGLALEEEIGRGGMGVVYRAHRSDGRAVALKLIPGAERARWTRWLAELLDLRHPNLLPLEAFGTHDGLHFVVMPLVPGGDLRERFDELAVGPAGGLAALHGVARLAEKVARAVAFLHSRGILHRDLKPSNILLAEPKGWEPLVCDFGLAGRLDEAAPGIGGTPSYMAPEQLEGRTLTVAADLWSLGAVLYELLAGRPPFVAAGGLDVAAKLAAPGPPPPRALNPAAADATLERVCHSCLTRDPAARYLAADELADDLHRFLDGYPILPNETNV
jgi:serine/threonine protein kinase